MYHQEGEFELVDVPWIWAKKEDGKYLFSESFDGEYSIASESPFMSKRFGMGYMVNQESRPKFMYKITNEPRAFPKEIAVDGRTYDLIVLAVMEISTSTSYAKHYYGVEYIERISDREREFLRYYCPCSRCSGSTLWNFYKLPFMIGCIRGKDPFRERRCESLLKSIRDGEISIDAPNKPNLGYWITWTFGGITTFSPKEKEAMIEQLKLHTKMPAVDSLLQFSK